MKTRMNRLSGPVIGTSHLPTKAVNSKPETNGRASTNSWEPLKRCMVPCSIQWATMLERAKGIEPSYAAWEAAVLPLNYARANRIFLIKDIPAMRSDINLQRS